MDNGSQRTYVTQAIKEKLNLQVIAKQKLQVVAFGEINKKSEYYETVELSIKSQYDQKQIILTAVVVPNICMDIIPEPKLLKTQMKHFNLNLADAIVSAEAVFFGINLLIGKDYYWQCNTSNCKVIADNLVMVETMFGWTVQGCQSQSKSEQVANVFHIHDEPEPFDLIKFWNLEMMGICNQTISCTEKTNLKIHWSGERYVVGLPSLNTSTKLNDNKNVALNRLRVLTAKLMKRKAIGVRC